MLCNSDCKRNNYSHINTFLKVGLGLEFRLRRLALPVFGPDARRSTTKAYSPHSTQDLPVTPPVCTRYLYYFPIRHNTFALLPHSAHTHGCCGCSVGPIRPRWFGFCHRMGSLLLRTSRHTKLCKATILSYVINLIL